MNDYVSKDLAKLRKKIGDERAIVELKGLIALKTTIDEVAGKVAGIMAAASSLEQ